VQWSSDTGKWAASVLSVGTNYPTLYGATGRSNADVVAVGDGQAEAIWNGSSWTMNVATATQPFLAVSPSIDSNYLAVGKLDSIAALTSTGQRTSPPGYKPTQADLTSAFNDTKSVWIGTARGDFLRYDTTGFTSSGTQTGHAIRSIWASDSTNIWAVGEAGTILHYDGTSWGAPPIPPPPSAVAYNGVSGTLFTKEVWVVGGAGTILHFDGQQWASWQHPSQATLRAVWSSFDEPTGTWIVGDSGLILHR
jgi:hypothetical protein